MKYLLLAPALLPTAHATPISLFDGKSLDGWSGDTAKTWRIEDGCITGVEPPQSKGFASTGASTTFTTPDNAHFSAAARAHVGLNFSIP